MKQYCVIEHIKDDIPGHRDWDENVLECFDSEEEAKKYLSQFKPSSIYHPGYGAGDGQIVTTYFIREVEKE
ncbi:MAG: hypothetical protein PHF05_05205 [Candidatus Izemoplasmatales bacterium]|nr:hypothetical protein [Candidatus Izemoplasmatales bacterium]